MKETLDFNFYAKTWFLVIQGIVFTGVTEATI
jgi:hypothetical protein